MRMQIRSQNALSAPLRSTIERRIRFVLGRFSGRVTSVTVLLTELQEPGGMATNLCKIIVHLHKRGQVCLEDTDAHVQAAVDHATRRIGHAVQRALERPRGNEECGASGVRSISGETTEES